MLFVDYLVLLSGALLCLFALGQFAFWAAQTWEVGAQNQKQFQLARELMRQQIEQAAATRNQTSQPATTTSAASPSEVASPSASGQAQTNPVNADGTWSGFREFIVSRLNRETERCQSVYLQPADGQPISSFLGGQHLPVRFEIPGQSRPVVRCYSLSQGPNDTHYRLSIKAVPDGLVSNFVNQQLREGDRVLAKVPAGKFVADTTSDQPMVMLAGGIGITPMISMMEEAVAKNSNRLMVLLYGVTNGSDQAFKDDLNQLAAQHDNIHVIHCYSKPTPDETQGKDYQVKGYVSVDLLKQMLPNQQCQFYLCGPPPFMNSLFQGLAEWGIPDEQIFSEAFGPASRSATPSREPTNKAPENAQTTTVRFSKSGSEFTWDGQHESLLEFAEAAGIEVDSGCRSGSCGTCEVRLLAGQVNYEEAVETEPGMCLPCVARPAAEGGPLELEA